MQYSVHIYRMTGSGAEKWVVSRGWRNELRCNRLTLSTHRYCCDYPWIVDRYVAVCLLGVLVDRLHLIGLYKNPVVECTQEAAFVMERESNHGAGPADQRIRPECQEVAIGFDDEIDNALFRRTAAFASQERQWKRKREKQISPREPNRLGTVIVNLAARTRHAAAVYNLFVSQAAMVL